VRSPAAPLAAEGARNSTALALAGMLFVAFVVRFVLIGADGFKNDVSTFESWSLTLAEHSLRDFYAKAGFADYPPGYFFVLWIVGHVYRLLVHSDPDYRYLKLAVKLPAILMDLVDSALIFAIVRRYSTVAWAFGAAAFFAFNPATIFISAYWGQVDSVAGGLTLLVVLFVLRSCASKAAGIDWWLVAAWVALAYSVLMKPPAIVLAPIMLVFPFLTKDRALRAARDRSTAAGIGSGLVLAYVTALAFHEGWNPIGQFVWLYGRYAYASGVYAYSSVNAFNLYAMLHPFWQRDDQLLPSFAIGGHAFGLPQYAWGVALFAAAILLVVSRLFQRRDEPVALLEAGMLLSFGYFILATRMHERYVFNALLLMVPLIYYRKRYLYAAVILSLTLLANLFYSLDYLRVMDAKLSGVDPSDLAPWITRPLATINVLTFFYLGYTFLGSSEDALQGVDFGALFARFGSRARAWFAPLEGLTPMRALDWALAGGLSVASFVLSYVGYALPSEKIFDEIYYARAGEEYLRHKEIFEFTHPPLTKLIITASMLLFGGMHGGGDTSAGWRFLNLVVGAVMVLVLYCFAKRLLGSTLFATLAAGMLLLDGFHYVQSRIATPEITVAFFSLLTLYAFYRLWIASQVRVAPRMDAPLRAAESLWVSGVLIAAFALSFAVARNQSTAAHVVAFLYFACGGYAAVRFFVPRWRKAAPLISYAEGTRVAADGLTTLDGGRIFERGALAAGESTQPSGDRLVHEADGLRIDYTRDRKARYATGEGEALFAPDGTLRAGSACIDGRRDGAIWLVLLSLAGGCLAASKWNGLFDFGVVWLLSAAIVSQRYWGPLTRAVGRLDAKIKPASWGNPFGLSLDLVVTMMAFVGATIYVLCYIPYFTLGHNLGDLVGLQQQMFGYHYDLKATHPYASQWWQWPLLQRPISYYYHDFRIGAQLQNQVACCVAEIVALPNPAVWWLGLVSVPLLAVLAWRERNKGYALLVTAYLLQWLPWITSPRIAFEYHFFPNLAVICLANAVLLQRVWRLAAAERAWPRITVAAYAALVVFSFAYFFPVVAGLHVPWNVWDSRMLHWLMHNGWV
jgi:4-amino-4-deoxy-L-arabinose transferase-like glycosyltransferase